MKHNGPLVVATLTQLELLLKDLRRTELRYIDLAEVAAANQDAVQQDAVNAPERRVSDIAEPETHVHSTQARERLDKLLEVKDSAPPKKARLAKRILGATARVSNKPKRFVWALRDSKKFDKALIDVAGLVGYLQEMLSQDQMSLLLDSAADFKLMLLQLSIDVGDMRALLWAGQPQRLSRASEETQAGDDWDDDTLVEDESAGASVALSGNQKAVPFWKSATRFSILMNRKKPQPANTLLLSGSDVKLDSHGSFPNDESRTAAKTITGSSVWVEWKPYELVTEVNEEDRVVRRIPKDTVERVQRLVGLLQETRKPVEFCVPPCLGYFQDDAMKRFGLVFEPPKTAPAWPPQSLLTAFAKKGITLHTKVQIAQDLSQWLLYLHAVNWLHKGLRSASVLFFAESGSLELKHPYVSGFEYSRLARGGVTTPGVSAGDIERSMYVHPDYLGPKRESGYKKTYDMYSLGIVLLEIAYWRPIDEILGSKAEQDNNQEQAKAASIVVGNESQRRGKKSLPTPSQIQGFRGRILEEPGILGRVVETMGDAYAKATRVCITGMAAFGLAEDEDQTAVEVGAYIQALFVEEVVDVLKSIRV